MKYLFKTLVILLVILLSLKLFIHIFDQGHEVSYSSGNFKIQETLKTNALYGQDDYYFKIIHEKFTIDFQVPVNYNKNEKIINTIKYTKIDNMNCIMPIFKGNKTLTDIMCVSDDSNNSKMVEIKQYHNLPAIQQQKLVKFVKELTKYNYNPQNYKDKAKAHKLSNTQIIYDENLVDNHYIAMETYKGLSLFSDKQTTIKLFDNDIYKKPIKIFAGKYYIIADYNEEYSFKNFYVVNIINGKTQKIRSYNEISFDTIIEGSVANDIYFFDKDAQTQYKISLKYENVEKVADKDNLKYYNGKWQTMSLIEANNGKTFNKYYAKSPENFTKADCPSKKIGYCYYYKQQATNPNNYEVYQTNSQNKKFITYLFTTTNINSVIYLDDYIYFQNQNNVYYYHNNGIRKVLTDTELTFNDDLSFGAYVK